MGSGEEQPWNKPSKQSPKKRSVENGESGVENTPLNVRDSKTYTNNDDE